MPVFYFHLHEADGPIEDLEGVPLASEAEARAHAVGTARDIMRAQIAEGRLCLSDFVLVEDEQHVELLRQPFRDAVEVSDCEPPAPPPRATTISNEAEPEQHMSRTGWNLGLGGPSS